VKQSHGSISVRSQEGKGSSFMIYLPRVKEPVANFSLGNNRIATSTGTETILLVDDAEPFRKLVRTVLESGGYTVLEARTSSEAAQVGANHDGPIDLLLTDVVMPTVDGYQLSDYLRFHRPEMKVLYMSGYSGSTGPGHAAFKFGTPVLPKPFHKDGLLLAIRQMLEGPQGGDASVVPQCLRGEVTQSFCD
jgi:two-component system cell cycle sensor histidine kinase/response regulator CckA